MSNGRRSQKRQIRLAFTPIPSSSPAAKGYHKQIRDRAAAVTLDGMPSAKRRKVHADTDGANDSLPTPAASREKLRVEVSDDSDEVEEPVRSTQRLSVSRRRSHKAPRQRQIDFSGARDGDTFSSPVRLSSSSRAPASSKPGMFSSQRTVARVSSEDSDDGLPSPSKLVREQQNSSRRLRPKDRASKEKIPRAVTQTTVSASDSEDADDPAGNDDAEAAAVESEDEDDEMPTTLGTQRRKRARARSRDSFIASSPPQIIESDDGLEIIEKPEKRSKPATPSRLKHRKQASQREKADLEEDLDFLEPSSDAESPRKKRNVHTEKKSARQSALDKLKRRRSSKAATSLEGGVDEVHDSPDELGALEEEDEDEDASDDTEQSQQARVKSSQMFREDEYDQDFIEEEDDDEPLGVPDGMPLEFTRYATMSPKELFKHAVEWSIQKKINPAFKKDDGIYNLTFKKLNDEVSGLANSKFRSAAWTPEFTFALNARPQIAYEALDSDAVEMHNTCDACNRTGHPATFQVQFQGRPYHALTLEEVAPYDDDDDDDDASDSGSDNNPRSDNANYNATGQKIAPEAKIYYVGRFCMSNAQTAHSLQHWRYHLHEWVMDWLDQEGYNAPSEIVRRDRWNTKKRRKCANNITDRLETEGMVAKLYRDYKNNINEARESKQGRYAAWD